jgi:small subunit ribosomal protein S5
MINTRNINKSNTGTPILERTVKVSRVAKVIKGGRTLRFTATIVVGNGNGKLGMGSGKASNVPDAVKKAVSQAKKNMIVVPIVNGTIPYEIKSKFCGSVVLLKPAPEGTGIKAGATLRAISEVLGIKNITTKVWRSTNPSNVVKAAYKGLNSMVDIKNELKLRTNTINNNINPIKVPVSDE